MKNSSDKCLTLDPGKGERAMIVKNAAGDWGILKGVWTGYKKGEPPKIRGTVLMVIFKEVVKLVQNVLILSHVVLILH